MREGSLFLTRLSERWAAARAGAELYDLARERVGELVQEADRLAARQEAHAILLTEAARAVGGEPDAHSAAAAAAQREIEVLLAMCRGPDAQPAHVLHALILYARDEEAGWDRLVEAALGAGLGREWLDPFEAARVEARVQLRLLRDRLTQFDRAERSTPPT